MCLFYPQQAGVIIQSHSAVFLPLLVSGGLIPVQVKDTLFTIRRDSNCFFVVTPVC